MSANFVLGSARANPAFQAPGPTLVQPAVIDAPPTRPQKVLPPLGRPMIGVQDAYVGQPGMQGVLEPGSTLAGISPSMKEEKAPRSAKGMVSLFTGAVEKMATNAVDKAQAKLDKHESAPVLPFDSKKIIDGATTMIGKIESSYAPGAKISGDDAERLQRARDLLKTMSDPVLSQKLEAQVKACAKDPLYAYLGPTKFSAMMNSSNIKMLQNPDAARYGLSDLERVALYNYSTGSYKEINHAMREGQMGPRAKAYIKHLRTGMEKLPDYEPQPGQTTQLHRAIFPAKEKGGNDWCPKAFTKGKTFGDKAFASTSADPVQGGEWTLSILGSKNTKNIAAFSAHAGEKEILALPGVKYTVADVNGKNVTLVQK